MFSSRSIQAFHAVWTYDFGVLVFEFDFMFLVRFKVLYTPLCLPFLGESSTPSPPPAVSVRPFLREPVAGGSGQSGDQ